MIIKIALTLSVLLNLWLLYSGLNQGVTQSYMADSLTTDEKAFRDLAALFPKETAKEALSARAREALGKDALIKGEGQELSVNQVTFYYKNGRIAAIGLPQDSAPEN